VISLRQWDKATPSLFLFWLICACSGPITEHAAPGQETFGKSVFVVHDAWHSAVVVRTADFSPDALPELRDFPGAEYLEFSWGDRDYFPHPDPGFSMALKAAFWSNGSIIHVVGVSGSLADSYPSAEIIAIPLSEAAFQRLLSFVSQTFSRPGPASASAALPGLSANARFYLAQGQFSIFRTCNTWVAEAVQAAELPINPGWVITAGSLGRHVRPLGRRVQQPAAGDKP
jgi:uncharacterized protein (TIGR02117 family)